MSSIPPPPLVEKVIDGDVPDPGGPAHIHTVTYAGLISIAAGVGLLVWAPHLGASMQTATDTGLALIAAGAGGATVGKSPLIP